MPAIKGMKVYVLSSQNKIIGVWSNLSKLVEENKKASKFVSYSKLSKMPKDSGVLEFTTKEDIPYKINIEKIK